MKQAEWNGITWGSINRQLAYIKSLNMSQGIKTEEKEKLILNVTQIINNVDSTNSCVNIGDDNTFKNIKNWIKQIEQNAQNTVCKVLVGNKCDLQSEISQEEILDTYEVSITIEYVICVYTGGLVVLLLSCVYPMKSIMKMKAKRMLQ